MQLTEHASHRMQQRGIFPMFVDLLLQFGAREPAGDGTEKLFFDKAAFKQLKAYAGPLANHIADYLDVYVLVAPDNRVITTAHRIERIKSH